MLGEKKNGSFRSRVASILCASKKSTTDIDSRL
ncbi:putative predicted protein [Rhizobium favelukesii]|uniref:Uncharacterized protein n=1 Tax=Rhizobium favelukesii TaxID=348824 RepID=W6RSP4_9HYPH|nr:putative predicted protein [Rhizobium favelukesii]